MTDAEKLHRQVWWGVECMARHAGLSVSGLACAAGLDASTFNKSKRIHPNGRLRWPSLASLYSAMQVSGVTVRMFADMAESYKEGCGDY